MIRFYTLLMVFLFGSVDSYANPTYQKPIQIDLFSGPLEFGGFKFTYEVSNNGEDLKVGHILINQNTFKVQLTQGENLAKGLHKEYADAKELALYFYWPESIIEESVVEAITKTGQVLWSFNLDKGEIQNWQNQLQSIKDQIKPKNPIGSSDFFKSNYALWAPQETASFLWRSREVFRFCLIQKKSFYRTSLCTPFYRVKTTGKEKELVRFSQEEEEVKILLNNEVAPAAQKADVNPERPIVFYTQLASGITFETVNAPKKMDLYDIKENSKNTSIWTIRGIGVQPVGINARSTKDPDPFLISLFSLQSTIGDRRDFWEAELDKAESSFYVPGESGGVFLYPLKVNWVPSLVQIPMLKEKVQKGTYSSNPRLSLHAPSKVKLKRVKDKLNLSNGKERLYNWYFEAPKKSEINRSYLDVNTDGGSYRGFYELYRGYSTELSARLTGIVSSTGGYVFMGEVALNHWFERIADWDQYYLSTLRWGVSAKYFQTFSKFSLGKDDDDEDVSASINATTFDVKYRATPGLWGRDETWGGLMGLQNLKMSTLNVNMLGVGVFWARSMPKIIDDIFNLFPFMNHPKWVDLEFIYFPVGMTADVKIKTNYSLNFHGKVMWSETFFGEAGFGLKSYAFEDQVMLQEIGFTTFYGTVGVGMNF